MLGLKRDNHQPLYNQSHPHGFYCCWFFEKSRGEMYQLLFRFLETADEYFNYSSHSPSDGQGGWRINGLSLPDEVLRKVYRDNAARLLKL